MSLAEHDSDPWRHPTLLAALTGAIAAVGATIFAISPMLSDIAASFGVPPAHAGRLIGVYSLAMAIVAPVVGLFGRRLPRVQIIVGGLLLFAVSWLVGCMTERFELLLGCTLIAGAATGAVVPAVYAYAADLSSFTQRARVMGLVISGWSIAILAVVPLMAIAGQAIGWRQAFMALALAALVCAAVLATTRQPRRLAGAHAPDGEAMPDLGESVRRVLGNRPTRILLLVNLVDMGAFYGVYAFLGSELRRINDWGAAPAGLMMACYGVGLIILSFNGRLIDRVGKTRTAIGTLLVLGAVLSLLPWLLSVPALLALGMVVWGAAQGGFFTSVTALVTEQVPALRGIVTAMLSGATYLGVSLFSPLAVWLFEHAGMAAVGLASGAACVLAGLVLYQVRSGVAAVERS
ncbi:MAG: MFS transporter [Burkholderiales bacterium]|nr:MFS transporter [Burkholderiales bacterium]